MKTIFEKTFVSMDQAGKAAAKELGEGWAKKHIVAKGDKGRYVIEVRKSARAKKEAKPVNPDALTRAQFNAIAASGKCPCCECTEDAIYTGRAPEGVVIEDDRHIGCHQCGWEFSFAAPKKMAEALNTARKGYVKTLSYAGNISADNADQVAEAIRGLTPEQVCAVADQVKGVKAGTYEARYASLNVGQRRMNAGNVIRAAVKNCEVLIEQLMAIVSKFAPAEAKAA